MNMCANMMKRMNVMESMRSPNCSVNHAWCRRDPDHQLTFRSHVNVFPYSPTISC